MQGNITVDSSVTEIDGIYIAKGTFNDNNGVTTAPQLVVKGGVYAGSVNLGRVLASGNDINPANVFNYDLKYLIGLNSLLGSPSVSWKEVAP